MLLKQYNPNFVKLNVFCDEFKDGIFDIITNYINQNLNLSDDNNYYKLVGYDDNVYIITNEKVNKFIDENINEITILTKNVFLFHTQINIDKKYIDKIDIDFQTIGQM